MIKSRLEGGGEVNAAETHSRWVQWVVLGLIAIAVVASYVLMSLPGGREFVSPRPSEANYNLLVQGFQDGHLSLKKQAPPGLAQLPDPYDPMANVVYRAPPYSLHDVCYYKNKLYLYFGVTPALLLFWPFAEISGQYLPHSQAVVIFCTLGFLASVGLLRAIWQRYFAEVSFSVMAACTLALGLATGVPPMLRQCDAYEVAISCGYLLTMLSLGAIWCALHRPQKRSMWLAAASLLYGLAVGARPSLLFGAVILLVPIIQARREKGPILVPLIAATGPLLLVGLGLMMYNAKRFDNPFEFGLQYQLAAYRQLNWSFFSWDYFWFNSRVYFLEPARWSSRFPFVHEINPPPLPQGHGLIESPYGILTNVPWTWLALAVPVCMQNRPVTARGTLRIFAVGVFLLFGATALTLLLFRGANVRYEAEFLPTLSLLAVLGVLGLERALVQCQATRYAVRLGWSLLLAFSVTFSLLANVNGRAVSYTGFARYLVLSGRKEEAFVQFERALRLSPEDGQLHYRVGDLYAEMNRLDEAEREFRFAARYAPSVPDAHFKLGVVREKLGKYEEAASAYRDAILLESNYAAAHNNLANLLAEDGKLDEAIQHYRQAIMADSKLGSAHHNLAKLLRRRGDFDGAIQQLRITANLEPTRADIQLELGETLVLSKQYADAIDAFRRALKLRPQDAVVGNDLAWLLATCPDPRLRDAKQAVAIGERLAKTTDRRLPGVLDTLAAGYAADNRFDEAVRTAKEALALAQVKSDSNLVNEISIRLHGYELQQPYRMTTQK